MNPKVGAWLINSVINGALVFGFAAILAMFVTVGGITFVQIGLGLILVPAVVLVLINYYENSTFDFEENAVSFKQNATEDGVRMVKCSVSTPLDYTNTRQVLFVPDTSDDPRNWTGTDSHITGDGSVVFVLDNGYEDAELLRHKYDTVILPGSTHEPWNAHYDASSVESITAYDENMDPITTHET